MSKLRGAVAPVLLSTNSASIAVASTGVVYTASFPLFFGEYFGLWVKAASAGVPDYKIELEQSYKVPTTEGSADTDLYYITKVISAQINNKLANVLNVPALPMAYGRYKITGINANPADTVLTMFNFTQE